MPSSILVTVFLHTNSVQARFTNERLPNSIETIGLPRLAR